MNIQREKIDIEKQEKWAKWELEKAKALEPNELEKEKLRLSSDMEESRSCCGKLASWMRN